MATLEVMWRSKWMRRRGFGIHSPFAYRFVVDVVNGDDDAYYDYIMLNGRWQRMLYRTAVFLQPSEIVEIGSGNAYPAQLACPRRQRMAPVWTLEESTKLAVAGEAATYADIIRLLELGWVVYADYGLRGKSYPGMVFHLSGGPSIIFPWHHLPASTYNL